MCLSLIVFVDIGKGFWETSSDDEAYRGDVLNGNASANAANGESKANADLSSESNSANIDASADIVNAPQASISEVPAMDDPASQQVSQIETIALPLSTFFSTRQTIIVMLV